MASRTDILRQRSLFTRHYTSEGDGVRLQRQVVNATPNWNVRNYVMNARRDKDRVDINKVAAGRYPRRDDTKVTGNPTTWHPTVGAVIIQRRRSTPVFAKRL